MHPRLARDVSSRLRSHHSSGGKFSVKRLLELSAEVAEFVVHSAEDLDAAPDATIVPALNVLYRYRELAATLAARGISCFVYDQRGHGSRPGERTHVERFEDFVDDLNLASASLQRQSRDLPLFVWGHSMGSIVVLQVQLDTQRGSHGIWLRRTRRSRTGWWPQR